MEMLEVKVVAQGSGAEPKIFPFLDLIQKQNKQTYLIEEARRKGEFFVIEPAEREEIELVEDINQR